MLYTITHCAADDVNAWCLAVAMTHTDAETPAEALNRFAAERPDRRPIEISDGARRYTLTGPGPWTDAELAAQHAAEVAEAARRKAERDRQRAELAALTLSELSAVLAYRARRTTETTPNADGVHVGDLFVSSWGYDQTNVDFYQVTELHGKHTAVIRRINGKRDETGDMQGITRPVRDSWSGYRGGPYTVRTKTWRGTPAIRDPYLQDHHLMDPTDDTAIHDWSAYA